MNNKLVLGTVQMGLNYGINNTNGKLSFETSCQILSKAFEMGIRTLDTAEAYGNAHNVIGDFHKLNPNIVFNIITKIPHGDIKDIQSKVNIYLEDLQVKYLDVLMFHSFESYLNNKEECNLVLKELKEVGIINHIGVSVYTNEQIEKLLLDDNITVVQMPFNLLDNNSLRGSVMKALKKKGKIIHTRSAFLQGLFFKENFDNEVSQKLSSELTAIKNYAEFENTNLSNLALSYCLNNELIDEVLIGVDSPEQLIDNLNALNYNLDQGLIDKINAIKVTNLDLLNPSLWK
ncbi:aldo/keto reductase [Flavobacterium sp. HJSW_4]|uniref:aldo/keto reductase n=1 Tax=Flavobacterium sp. HJSW_4 TaxID=3344660 RepID=UPI0035F3B5A7